MRPRRPQRTEPRPWVADGRRRARPGVEGLEARQVLSNMFIPSIVGSVPTPPADAAPPTAPPAPPSSLAAVGVSDTEVNLTWRRGDDADAAVVVSRRAPGESAYAALAVLPAHSDIYTDTSCYPSTTYSYIVTARNALGDSAPGPERQASTRPSQATLLAPADLAATAVDATSATLTFRDVNPYLGRADLRVDPTRGQVVSSAAAPFAASDVGRTLSVSRRSWWYMAVDPTSRGQVISDGHNPFTAADVGTSLRVGGGGGWVGGTYKILAVDAPGKATLDAPAASPSTTSLGNAADGWLGGDFQILAVDAQGRATLAGAPAPAGNPNWASATVGTPLGRGSYAVERADGGGPYRIVAQVPNASASMSWTDTYLAPSASYSYRVRLASYAGGVGDYSAPAALPPRALPPGAPASPGGLSAANLSATANALSWVDNAGGRAAYKVERAVYSWTGQPQWSTVGVTALGATSYTDATAAAESFYYYRVRATGPAGDSPPTAPVTARTASVGTGAARTYEIGPGRAYATLGALDWTRLGPGDLVRIYPNRDAAGAVVPYREHLLISVRGTAAAPIRVVGVPDPATGAMPILDGQDATTARQFASHYTPIEGNELLVGTRPDNNRAGWNPGYLDIQGLEIRGAYRGDAGGRTYTNSQGVVTPYDNGAAGIYLEKADHLTIGGGHVHGNGNGIFGAAQDDARELSDLVIDAEYVHDDGNPGRDREHELYIEGVDVTYQNSRFGPTHGGGSALKDRSVGVTIRGNWIEGGGHLLDLVEAQNQQARALTMPAYRDTYVTGNVLFNPAPGGSVTPVHYGGDQGLSPFYRKGVLHFAGNTLVSAQSQSQVWSTTLFATASAGESVDARDDILFMVPTAAGQTPTEMDLLPSYGVASFERGWVTPGWQFSRTGTPFAGVAAGTAGLVADAGNTPGGVDIANLVARFRAGLVAAAPPTATAGFLGLDATTQGNWRGAYGSDGLGLAADADAPPAYAALAPVAAPAWTWEAGNLAAPAPQRSAAAGRVAAAWYDAAGFTLDLNLADGAAHKVSLYALDYDRVGRTERVDVLDAATGATLDSRAIAGFADGRYLSWRLSGHVLLRVTNLGPANAVLSGIFLDKLTPIPPTATAGFLGLDATTQGNWRGAYGSDGLGLAADADAPPAYAALAPVAAPAWTWEAGPLGPRAPQRADGPGRVAAAWYDAAGFTLDLNLADGAAHKVSLYALDYDRVGRTERVDVLDAATGATLDSRAIAGFADGRYLSWRLSGHVLLRVTNLGPANAVLSGIFLDRA